KRATSSLQRLGFSARNRHTSLLISAPSARCSEANAATTSAARPPPTNSAPSYSPRPKRGSTGRLASLRPNAVIFGSALCLEYGSAPSWVSVSTAASNARGGNGSGRRRPVPSAAPQQARSRTAWRSEERRVGKDRREH